MLFSCVNDLVYLYIVDVVPVDRTNIA